ncbi:CGNR zinc finger domain-containing protein [Chitinophaga nivalis]|uniref:CGNR zinc finger domain-containing protein n=1 Tax=Chitinophaga nivalis TaxID=2991709 RepID=A0ABT3IKW9_9BACT|nr:CGNR zinc finger domain-containing protein [Chitinophaga nivalis]MCW3465702.1 CGNR zinc finger domain-containing protein [Chitinophaga nivalis]MCW3484607.1 CGNR zinc finger domain-containing protein [Chitinophaga nivalis]
MEKPITDLRLYGGVLCLDFVNTVSNRKKEGAYDYLAGFKILLQWYAHTGALSPKIIHTLERLAKGYPQKAAVIFEKNIQLRELLHRIFIAAIHRKPPLPPDLVQLNAFIADTYANIEMSWLPAGKTGQLQFNAPALEQVNWWLVKSAVELYTGNKLQQVRECPSCGWLFLDNSRNGSRKWCSMSTCGDVSKVTRCYERNKKSKHTTDKPK